MTADEHLAALKRLATAQLRLVKQAAVHEHLSLVDAGRLETLELLVTALAAAVVGAKMTRDYADVQGPDFPNTGKKYLLGRDEFTEVLRLLSQLRPRADLPAGCFSGDSRP